jgi:hypothetical protein
MLSKVMLSRCFLIILLVLLLFKFYTSRESFNNIIPLAAGNYSIQSSGLILEKNYKPKNKQIDIAITEKNLAQFKINPAGSYKQETNNKRYVNNPDNGKCLPKTMCMQFYTDDPDQEQKNDNNNTINSSWKQSNRINFFNQKMA